MGIQRDPKNDIKSTRFGPGFGFRVVLVFWAVGLETNQDVGICWNNFTDRTCSGARGFVEKIHQTCNTSLAACKSRIYRH